MEEKELRITVWYGGEEDGKALSSVS